MKKIIKEMLGVLLVTSAMGLSSCGLFDCNHKVEDSSCEKCGFQSYSDCLEFTLNNNEYSVSAIDGFSAKSTIIPSEYEGIKVTSIKDGGFRQCKTLEKIGLPEGLEVIGREAFYYCPLVEITIPSTVEEIKSYAFWGAKLKSIYIPAKVTSLGDNIVAVNKEMESIVVDSNNPKYDSRNNCNAIIVTETNILKSACATTVIPEGVVELEMNAFSNIPLIENLYIPASLVGYIGSFPGCNINNIVVDSNNPKYDSRDNCNAIIETAKNELLKGSNNTVIPNSVTSIAYGSFRNCKSLKTIAIPEGIKYIYHDTFVNCEALEEITLPSTLEHLGASSFLKCKSLKTIVIPGNVKRMEREVFKGCESLTIYCEAEAASAEWDSTWNVDNRPVYWASQWEYDGEGNPTPKN